jgi:hypothetical protein
MEAWQIIQECELAPGLYGKRKFINAINNLSTSDFDRFCRAYLHLMEFYSRTQGAWVTDYPPLVAANPSLFWKLEPIDFDSPVLFIRKL